MNFKKLIFIIAIIFISLGFYTKYILKFSFPENEKIVIFSPVNGIGNQLFGFAAAKSLSEKLGAKLWIIHQFHRNSYEKEHRTFALDSFLYEKKSPYDKLLFTHKNLFKKLLLIKNNVVKIDEDNFFSVKQEDGDIFYLCPKDMFYDNPKYFENINTKIKNIEFKNPLPQNNLINQINNTQSVAVHIRRGDFAQYNWILPINYQKNAIAEMRKKLENPHFFIFSDDLEFATKEFANEKDVTIASETSIPSFSNAMRDLQLMSRAKHIIICNSTFSWWAAYIMKNPNKIVIAPLEIKYNDSKHYYPDEWIVMQ